jgi:hypothetical protein
MIALTRRVSMVLAALAMVFAAGMFTGAANAMPLSQSATVQSAFQDSDVTLVRDGCGRGMRWSHRRQSCVPAFDRGPVVVVPPVVVPRFVAPIRPGCGRGWRWSNSRGRCVPAF